MDTKPEPKITICPPGPEPKRFTVSCTEMGALLANSPDGDLTIKNRMIWDSWQYPLTSKTVEDWLVEMFVKNKEQV